MSPATKPVVFIGYAGERSERAAAAVHRLLGQLFGKHIKVWTAKEDVEAGQPWFDQVTGVLKCADIGIFCLTRENRSSTWLHFEAGALIERVEQPRLVIPLLVDGDEAMPPAPLNQFQVRYADAAGISKLVQTVAELANQAASEQHLADGSSKLVQELSLLNEQGRRRLRRRALARYVGFLALGVVLMALVHHITRDRTAPPASPIVVDLYTGTRGGAFDALGLALADRMNRATGSSLEVKVLKSDGSVENCQQLAEQEHTQSPRNLLALGPITSFVLASDNATCSQSVQVIAPLYQEVTHVVVRREAYFQARKKLRPGEELLCSLIHQTRDKAYFGMARSGTRVAIDQVLKACPMPDGLDPAREPSGMSFAQAGQALHSGKLDLGTFGLPVDGQLTRNLIIHGDLCIVPISEKLLAKVQSKDSKNRLMTPFKRAGIYAEAMCEEGSEFVSRGAMVFLAGNTRTSAEVVERALEALFEGNGNDLRAIAPDIVTDPCSAMGQLQAHRHHPAALPALKRSCDRRKTANIEANRPEPSTKQ